ncbi:MAG: TetR/AcrR family transcriptional regulator [Acidimicrobiales bacterium]
MSNGRAAAGAPEDGVARSPHPAAPAAQEPAGPRSHGGRQLDPTRDDAICAATLELLAERGYDCLTVEAVAARAGAGKATVYRRWASKEKMVADALSLLAPPAPLPDTGSLRGDCEHLCTALSNAPDEVTVRITQGLTSALCRNPELMTIFHRHFMEPRREALAVMLRRAVARGEMPAGKDIDLLTSLVPALMFYRKLVTCSPADADFARRVVDQVLVPAATAPLPVPAQEGTQPDAS